MEPGRLMAWPSDYCCCFGSSCAIRVGAGCRFSACCWWPGFLNVSIDLWPPPAADHISHFADGSPLNLEGQIVSMENTASGGYRLLVEMRRAMTPQGAARCFRGHPDVHQRRGTAGSPRAGYSTGAQPCDDHSASATLVNSTTRYISRHAASIPRLSSLRRSRS